MNVCACVCVDQERGGERSEGDLAHLQTHQADEEDRPLPGPQAPAEVSPGHSPVRPRLALSLILTHTPTPTQMQTHNRAEAHSSKAF